MKIAKLRQAKVQGLVAAYLGTSAIIDDDKIGEQYIVIARDTSALQRACAKIGLQLTLDTRKCQEVRVTLQ